MSSQTKSNYPNLYDILNDETEEIAYEEERRKHQTQIAAAESTLRTESGQSFLPEIESFLTLLSQKLNITCDPQCHNRHRQPDTNPEASAPPSEIGSDGEDSSSSESWIEGERRAKGLEELRAKVLEEHRLRRQNISLKERLEEEQERRQRLKEKLRSKREQSRAQSAGSAPVIINNNNNNNNGGCPSLAEVGVMSSMLSCHKNCQDRTPCCEKKSDGGERKDKVDGTNGNDSDALVRSIAALMALGVGAVGVYALARDAGTTVSDEELDAATLKAGKILDALVTANSILRLSNVYRNLDKCVSTWQSYRQQVQQYRKTQSFNQKMMWIPVATSCAIRAFLPMVWQGHGDLLLTGTGLALGYGALNWLYEKTYYHYAHSKQNQWKLEQVTSLITSLL